MTKFLYEILKLEEKPWIKFWIIKKKTWYTLSEILKGTNFSINKTKYKRFNIFNIFGNSVQDGEPSPENEVEIKSSGENGYITEKIVNENLLRYPYYNTTRTTNGITFIDNGNGTITINGTATSDAYFTFYNNSAGDRLKLPKGTYKLSSKTIIPNGINFTFAPRNSDGTTIAGVDTFYLNGSNISVVQTINQPFEVFANIVVNSGTTINNYTFYPMLEKDSTATSYIEHQEQNFNIPCQQPMRSIGTTRDCFFKNTVDSEFYDSNLEENKWYEKHFIKRKIFDGTENWNYGVSNAPINIELSDSSQLTDNNNSLPNILCNMYTKRTYNSSWSLYNYLITAQMESNKLFFRNTDILNLESWKILLEDLYENDSPLYVDYPLNTPTNLLCTEAQTQALENLQNAKTYNNQTNIFSEDEVPANLEIQCFLKGSE